MVYRFVDFSSGIAWFDSTTPPPDYQFIRIQSTACEQKRWSFIIEDLDYAFLIAVASGEPCIVYDASARKAVSRAVYQGLPWIKFCCEMRWTGEANDPFVKGHNCRAYFTAYYGALSDRAKRKLDYVGKYANGSIQLIGQCLSVTVHGVKPLDFKAILPSNWNMTLQNRPELQYMNPKIP